MRSAVLNEDLDVAMLIRSEILIRRRYGGYSIYTFFLEARKTHCYMGTLTDEIDTVYLALLYWAKNFLLVTGIVELPGQTDTLFRSRIVDRPASRFLVLPQQWPDDRNLRWSDGK